MNAACSATTCSRVTRFLRAGDGFAAQTHEHFDATRSAFEARMQDAARCDAGADRRPRAERKIQGARWLAADVSRGAAAASVLADSKALHTAQLRP